MTPTRGTNSCCCTPSMERNLPPAPAQIASGSAPADIRQALRASSVLIPGGEAEVGTDRPLIAEDGEGPRRLVQLDDFRMGRTAVTNEAFTAFVNDTGYITEAELFGWSFVFHQYVKDAAPTAGVVGADWWRAVEGAAWHRPEGPSSTVSERGGDPAVHISWNDAQAFAAWVGGRLPSEAEWEHAARGGLKHATYPWGDQAPDDHGYTPCNIWQGNFPTVDRGIDGYRGLAPAQSFEPNGYGLYNCCGNCWEWTADEFRVAGNGPQAIARNNAARAAGFKVLKGGSHLCHASYCHRYRIAARTGNTPDAGTGHTGFRVAFAL